MSAIGDRHCMFEPATGSLWRRSEIVGQMSEVHDRDHEALQMISQPQPGYILEPMPPAQVERWQIIH